MCLLATEADRPVSSPFAARLDAACAPHPPVSTKTLGGDSTPPPALLGGSPRSPFDAEALSAALSSLRTSVKAAVGLTPGGDAAATPPASGVAADAASSSRASRSTRLSSWTGDVSADGSEACTRDAAGPMDWDDDDTPAGPAAAGNEAEPGWYAAADSALATWSYSDAALLPRQDSFEKKWGRWADDMIDAHLDDGTDLDCGSDVESEFGGAAAYDHDTSASPEPGCGGGPASDAAALPLNGAASPDNSNWQPMGAFGSDVRSGTVPEAGAATGASGLIVAHLPQGWKLAEHGSGQAGKDSIAMVPVRQRSHGSNQLPIHLIRITTVLVVALAVAWGFMLVSPSSELSLTVQPA